MTQKKSLIAEQQVVEVKLSLINVSSYNPRKSIDDDYISELAASIKQHGVVQPITLRKKGKKYEIVCGECRYRAANKIDLHTIPSLIRQLTDQEAKEIAIIENLQRKDITPLEEAEMFHSLIQSGKYDVLSLVLKFNKSESFIYSRLLLNKLIDQLKELFSNDLINISTANLLANYSSELQEEIYKAHFNPKEINYYGSWLKLSTKEVKSRLESYSSKLSKLFFDKSACTTCPFNTKTFTLFNDKVEEGDCTNKTCLKEKLKEYMYNKAINLLKKYPEANFCKTHYNGNEECIEKLKKDGHDIFTLYMSDYPTLPVEPDKQDFANENLYNEDYGKYQEQMIRYEECIQNINQKLAVGEIVNCIEIGNHDIYLRYASNETVDEKTKGKKGNKTIEDQILSLEEKKKRNIEIRNEKITKDLKTKIRKLYVVGENLTELDESLFYSFLLRWDSKEQLTNYGIENIDKVDRLSLHLLSELEKAAIIREFIKRNLIEGWDKYISNYMKEHHLAEYENIANPYIDSYEKRNVRLDERIEDLKKANNLPVVKIEEKK